MKFTGEKKMWKMKKARDEEKRSRFAKGYGKLSRRRENSSGSLLTE
jgi:hypothetical protein